MPPTIISISVSQIKIYTWMGWGNLDITDMGLVSVIQRQGDSYCTNVRKRRISMPSVIILVHIFQTKFPLIIALILIADVRPAI